MPTIVLLLALVLGLATSAYFSYVGGVSGKSDLRLLHPVGLGSMLVALAGGVALSLQLDTWHAKDFVVLPPLLTMVAFFAIACVPFVAYSTGCDEKKQRDEKRARDLEAERRSASY